MARLYKIISEHLTRDQIEALALEVGVQLVPNALVSSMARELFLGAKRNLRLDFLFEQVHEQIAGTGLDLGENLYELIAGAFNENEAARLTAGLGFDQMNVGLDAGGLIGWNHDDFHKRQKAELIQKTAVNQQKYSQLLDELAAIRPGIILTPFRESALAKGEGGAPAGNNPPAQKAPTKTEPTGTVYHIYGDHIVGSKIGGDNVGGDKVGGDKVGGDMYKGITVSGNTGSAIAFGGDASVTNVNQIQNQDDLLKFIAQIKQELAAIRADLDASDAEEATEILEEVEQELQAENPSPGRIARKLRYVSQIAEAVTTAVQVTANIGIAVQAVQALFGG